MTRSEEDVPYAQRMILNSNLGVTNIIEHDAIVRDMGKVTDSIFAKLKAHYGPYSSFAGIDENKPLVDTEFTKDGKSIINAIEFASPLEDWVRRAIAYIGKNIEKAAGDGTTSSMMFACSMLKHMTATLDVIRPVNYNQFYDDWKAFTQLVADHMKEYILSVKDSNGEIVHNRVKDMAYMQAYTSSHGNVDLSEAVARMFECTPPGMWSKMQFGRRLYESEKLFEVEETHGQYWLETEIFSKTVFNKDMGSWLEYKNATLVILNDQIYVDSPHWKTIKDLIEKSTEEAPVVIFCHNTFDNATYGELMDLTKANNDGEKKYHFAVFGLNPVHFRVNDFTVLQTITGHNPLEFADDNRPCIHPGVSVKYVNKKLELNDLYKDDREATDMIRERPGYKTNPAFEDFADTIKKFIESLEDGADQNHTQNRELHELRTMYNRLIYDKAVYLVIGGNTFDNLAMHSVADDVIRATVRSLENGMVVSNNKTLYWCVEEIVGELQRKMNSRSPSENRILWFGENVLKTLDEFSDVVLDQLYPHGKKSVKGYVPETHFFNFEGCAQWFDGMIHSFTDNPSVYIPPNYHFSRYDREQFRSWWFNNSVNMLNYDNSNLWEDQCVERHSTKKQIIRRSYFKDTMIVQPANADIVMLQRFGEIALKFILTERVIVKGSAYLNKEKK